MLRVNIVLSLSLVLSFNAISEEFVERSALLTKLIKQMDDDVFDAREQARLELVKLGPAAFAEMFALAKDASDESRRMLMRVIHDWFKDPATVETARQNFTSLGLLAEQAACQLNDTGTDRWLMHALDYLRAWAMIGKDAARTVIIKCADAALQHPTPHAESIKKLLDALGRIGGPVAFDMALGFTTEAWHRQLMIPKIPKMAIEDDIINEQKLKIVSVAYRALAMIGDKRALSIAREKLTVATMMDALVPDFLHILHYLGNDKDVNLCQKFLHSMNVADLNDKMQEVFITAHNAMLNLDQDIQAALQRVLNVANQYHTAKSAYKKENVKKVFQRICNDFTNYTPKITRQNLEPKLADISAIIRGDTILKDSAILLLRLFVENKAAIEFAIKLAEEKAFKQQLATLFYVLEAIAPKNDIKSHELALRYLHSGPNHVRIGAIRLLGRVGNTKTAILLAQMLADTQDVEIRQTLLNALGSIGEKSVAKLILPYTAPLFATQFNASLIVKGASGSGRFAVEKLSVQQLAAVALARLGIKDHLSLITANLKRLDADMRWGTALALNTLAEPDTLPAIKEALQSETEIFVIVPLLEVCRKLEKSNH